MKYCWLTILLISILLSSCGNKYLNPEKIELSQYTSAAKEFIKNKSALNTPDLLAKQVDDKSLSKYNFNANNKKLVSNFPLFYKLLLEKKAEEITYQSEGCVIIILKIHDGFSPTEELIRTGGASDCGAYSTSANSGAVEKDIPLKNGWRYQRASFWWE